MKDILFVLSSGLVFWITSSKIKRSDNLHAYNQRKTTSINSNWECLESNAVAINKSSTPSQGSIINLPHSWNSLDATDMNPGYRRCSGWHKKVLDQKINDDSRYFLYCEDESYPNLYLLRGEDYNLKSETGVVSFESFIEGYKKNQNQYLVLQGHPGKWVNKSFLKFEKVVIFFLKENGLKFMLPYQYYKHVTN